MFRKKLYKHYPIFFAYLLFEFVQFCVVFSMLRLKVPVPLYVKVDLFARIGDAALSFGIIQELFSGALVSLDSMRAKMARLLRWGTVGLVLLASLCIWALCYSRPNPAAFPGYWSIEALRVAQCSLLFLVFLWHRLLGVRMSGLSFGIALGVGLIAAVDLLALTFKTSLVLPNGTGMLIDILNMAAYHIAVLIWLYFAVVREEVAFDSRTSFSQLRQHAAELGRIAR